LWLGGVGLCAVTCAQQAAGQVVFSEKSLFSLGTVVLLLGIASAAWAVKSDVRSVREGLAAHAGDHDAHHAVQDLQNQFVLRREHEACLGTVQVSLQRIEEALSRKD
jgi:hypothetical protein